MKTTSIPPALLLAILLPVSANAASIVQFQARSFKGHESSGTGHLFLTCTPPPTNRVTVLLKVTGGSADIADLGFVNSLRVDQANWQAGWPVELLTGNTETEVGFSIVGDGAPEPDETLHLTLTVLSGDAVVGARSNAVFTIRNGHPSIWVGVRPTAAEGTPVRCQFYRYGDTNVVLSVGYSTADDTARTGVDYVAAAGSVTFAAGQLEAEIQVPTLDNGRVDGDRAFLLNFSNATFGVELRDANAIAVILDNEQPVVWDRSFTPWPLSESATFALSSDGKLVVTEYPGPPLYSANGTRVVRWNADGTPDSGFAPAQFTHPEDQPLVQRLVLDAAGRCYVAGRFEAVNQQPRSGLARLLPDGALDESFRPPPDLVFPYGSVHLAVQPDGRLLCLTYASEDARRFFRLNGDGSLDDSFRPAAVSLRAEQVWATAHNQALVRVPVWGEPTAIGRPLARLDLDGSLDPTFHRAEFVARDGSIGTTIVDMVQLPDGRMMVAGTFGSVDGRPRPNLLRLNADGTVDAGFAPPADIGLEDAQTISSIAVDPEGRVFVVGRFRRFNGRDAGSSGVHLFRTEQFFSLLRLKADGTPDDAFAPLGDDALLQMAPEMLMVDPWVGWPWPVAGGGMLEVFPQSDGKLLAYGYLGLWQRWDIRPGPHFLARIYDGPPATSVELATARLVAGPGAEQATVTVRRLGDSIGPATVNYTTRDGSAMAGRDYGAASGTLSFAPLEVVKSFTVPLLDPGQRRQDREFSVTLSDATGVEGISGPATQLVLVAPFGFQRIIGPPDNPRLTIYGSVGSTYLLEAITSLENAWSARGWSTAAAAVTLTNEVQTIHDPWQDATTPARLYRLRHLAP